MWPWLIGEGKDASSHQGHRADCALHSMQSGKLSMSMSTLSTKSLVLFLRMMDREITGT